MVALASTWLSHNHNHNHDESCAIVHLGPLAPIKSAYSETCIWDQKLAMPTFSFCLSRNLADCFEDRPDHGNSAPLTISDFKAMEIAQQLTLSERALFLKIEVRPVFYCDLYDSAMS